MTEAQWLACTDTRPMLSFIWGGASGRARGDVSARKLGLLLCACCRHLWPDTTEEERTAVEAARRFADGGTAGVLPVWEAVQRLGARHLRPSYTRYAVEAAVTAVATATEGDPVAPVENALGQLLVAAYWTGPAGYDRARITARYAAREALRTRQASAVRCIFGNPFRPVSAEPAWLTPNVVGLAHRVYDEGAFHCLPVLGDALEEAGCDHAPMLSHCRNPGEHALGCWVVDLLHPHCS